MHIYEICTLLRFYEELVKFCYWSKSTSYWTVSFLRPNTSFDFIWWFGSRFILIIRYKMSLKISYHKMVDIKYCKMEIYELICFNHSLMILSQFLTMTKKAKIRSINANKDKSKSINLQRNGSNGLLIKRVSYWFFDCPNYKVGNQKEGGIEYIPYTRDTQRPKWYFLANINNALYME